MAMGGAAIPSPSGQVASAVRMLLEMDEDRRHEALQVLSKYANTDLPENTSSDSGGDEPTKQNVGRKSCIDSASESAATRTPHHRHAASPGWSGSDRTTESESSGAECGPVDHGSGQATRWEPAKVVPTMSNPLPPAAPPGLGGRYHAPAEQKVPPPCKLSKDSWPQDGQALLANAKATTRGHEFGKAELEEALRAHAAAKAAFQAVAAATSSMNAAAEANKVAGSATARSQGKFGPPGASAARQINKGNKVPCDEAAAASSWHESPQWMAAQLEEQQELAMQNAQWYAGGRTNGRSQRHASQLAPHFLNQHIPASPLTTGNPYIDMQLRAQLAAAATAAAAGSLPTRMQWPREGGAGSRHGGTTQRQSSSRMQATYSMEGMDADAKETLRTHLQDLHHKDPSCVFIVRKINRLGFDSPAVLKEHFAQYGRVETVLVAHSHVKCPSRKLASRLRPSGLGFVVMKACSDVEAILADGEEQVVGGATIRVQRFQRLMQPTDD